MLHQSKRQQNAAEKMIALGANARISQAVGKGGQDNFGGQIRVATPSALEKREIVAVRPQGSGVYLPLRLLPLLALGVDDSV